LTRLTQNCSTAAALMRLGTDANALDAQRYDAVTIAAVANDATSMNIALAGGNRPDNVISPYDGTALIASAHMGHVEVVRTLIAAGAPLNHVNNLGWAALIEAIILGDGGTIHSVIVELKGETGSNATASATTQSHKSPVPGIMRRRPTFAGRDWRRFSVHIRLR